jgi:hypothetical protein
MRAMAVSCTAGRRPELRRVLTSSRWEQARRAVYWLRIGRVGDETLDCLARRRARRSGVAIAAQLTLSNVAMRCRAASCCSFSRRKSLNNNNRRDWVACGPPRPKPT